MSGVLSLMLIKKIHHKLENGRLLVKLTDIEKANVEKDERIENLNKKLSEFEIKYIQNYRELDDIVNAMLPKF